MRCSFGRPDDYVDVGDLLTHLRDVIRALFDAKEKAEQDNARLRQAIERKDECLRLVFKGECNRLHISAAIAYTDNDDTGG